MSTLRKQIESVAVVNLIGSPAMRWMKNDLYLVDYKVFKIAFEVFIGKNNVAIDIVLRPGVKRDVLVQLYPHLYDKNKWRIMTINKAIAPTVISTIINTEFGRILELFNSLGSSINSKMCYVDLTDKLISVEPIKMYFFDGTPNFGDLVGPWLASKLTGRPVLNIRNTSGSTGAIYGVGSIVNSITKEHKNSRIWGSGLITDARIEKVMANLKEANIEKISSVRGKITAQYLRDYGFNVPEIYGDPALIFSDLYTPKKTTVTGEKVIVPHYIHYKLFKSLNLEGYHIVNVRDNVTDVIDQIAGAKSVISTSMHGLILAQSFQVPWLHLHISDELKLAGDDFKFKDFFTTLDANKVGQVKIMLSELNQQKIDNISLQAYLPNYDSCYNSESIIEAFNQCL